MNGKILFFFRCFQVHHGGAGTTATGLKAAVRTNFLILTVILSTSSSMTRYLHCFGCIIIWCFWFHLMPTCLWFTPFVLNFSAQQPVYHSLVINFIWWLHDIGKFALNSPMEYVRWKRELTSDYCKYKLLYVTPDNVAKWVSSVSVILLHIMFTDICSAFWNTRVDIRNQECLINFRSRAYQLTH